MVPVKRTLSAIDLKCNLPLSLQGIFVFKGIHEIAVEHTHIAVAVVAAAAVVDEWWMVNDWCSVAAAAVVVVVA